MPIDENIQEIQPIDERFSINLSTQTPPTKHTEQQHRFALKSKLQKEQSLDSTTQSTAMLHPILEDNEIKCPHNGVVKLKSNRGKSFKSKDMPMILESDLINSQIIGCTNNILGVPTHLVA